jgi:hypothetical protein
MVKARYSIFRPDMQTYKKERDTVNLRENKICQFEVDDIFGQEEEIRLKPDDQQFVNDYITNHCGFDFELKNEDLINIFDPKSNTSRILIAEKKKGDILLRKAV